jgi:two-component sensor histidine kinase
MDGFSSLDIVETIRTPVLVLDPDLRVAFANRAFYQAFRVQEAETVGRLVYDLGHGQWDIARLRELLHEVIPTNSVVEDFLVEAAFPRIGHRVMCLNARKVFRPGNHTMRLLLAFEDITDRVQRERDQEQAKQEIYHRVKNSLTVIMSFVSHEARQAGSDVRTLQALQGRIAAVAQLYDLIARSETAEAIRGDAYLDEIAANLTASLLGEKSDIVIAVEAEPLPLHKDASVPIGLVVNELATNAIKHAFPSGKGAIRIALKRQEDNIVRLSVTDNGIGLDATVGTKGTGFGARYVGAFVRQLDSTLFQASSIAGSSFDIRLPVSVLAA